MITLNTRLTSSLYYIYLICIVFIVYYTIKLFYCLGHSSFPIASSKEGSGEANAKEIRTCCHVSFVKPSALSLRRFHESFKVSYHNHKQIYKCSKRFALRTRETLQTGNLLSVINVLMQLRKVCNHPNMFEVRPTISPFQMEGISFHTPRLISDILEYDPFTVSLW